jgi:hypothetical protein
VEIGRKQRQHLPYCYSSVVAGAAIARGMQYGESDATASLPKENRTHPAGLLATVYYALGIDPDIEIRAVPYSHAPKVPIQRNAHLTFMLFMLTAQP